MKNTSRIIFLCVFYSIAAWADDSTKFSHIPEVSKNSALKTVSPAKSVCRKPYPYLEAKVGYFFFASHIMRKVYDQGGIDVQLAGAYPIPRHWSSPDGTPRVYWPLRIYGSIEYLWKVGRSLAGHQRTTFWAIPISLGLQPVARIFDSNWHTIDYYMTLGPRFFFTHVHNYSSYVSRTVVSNNIGGFINTGFFFTLYHRLKLDLFGEYSYVRLHYSSHVPNSHGHTVQTGGFTFGGGLAYAF